MTSSNVRGLRHESLEDRRLLAVVSELPQPHFFDSQSILAAASDPTQGDLPFDALLAEARIQQLAERVAGNENYRVDEFGNVMAIDRFTSPADSRDKETPDVIRLNPFPTSQTFLLHSLPGATKTIYLDFTGHTTSGTSWNSQVTGGADINTTAFNFEGSAATLSNNEHFRIQRIWERVSEDFLPFNVNVTTQEPALSSLIRSGGGDTQWGVRVVIGPDNWFGGAGGVAFVGSFNWSSDTPAFVFSNALSNSEKDIAEAVSHEVGHTLGLSHDGNSGNQYYTGHGSGATGWAPIMGVGYNRDLVQWSRGEYPTATNTENDLTILTSQNGFSYRTDDHGSSTITATPLNVLDSIAFEDGIIERNTDRDFFSFTTAGGLVNISIDPFYRSPNLDILATLYNSAGSVISTNNGTSTLNATFSSNLSAGNYFLSVEGTGKTASGSDYGYSNYGSLGYYSIQASIPQDVGSLVATLSNGDLTILDPEGVANQLNFEILGNDLVITDSNEKFVDSPVGGALSNGDRTLTIPYSSITGSVIVDTGGGDDTVQLGFWFGPVAPGLAIVGGSGSDLVSFNSSLAPDVNKSLLVAAESVNIGTAVALVVTGTGVISLSADQLNIASDANVLATASSVTVTPQTLGRTINLGSKSAGQLGLTNTEINRISASTIVLGSSSSGEISVSSNIVRSTPANLELRSGDDILISNGSIDTAGGTLLMAPGTTPFGVRPTAVGTDVSANNVSFESDLILEINGNVADVSYDRLQAVGTVDLTGVDLVLAGSFPGITGSETFSLITATSIVGTFNGLPDQSSVLVHGKMFVISYLVDGVQLAPAATNSTVDQSYVYHVGSSFASGGIPQALDNSKVLAKEGQQPLELTYENLISSSRGINGLVFDFEGLPVTALTAADFEFQMSPQGAFVPGDHPPANWQAAPSPTAITVLPGVLDRVVLEWPDNAIANRWLRVTIKSNASTGLAEAETYYIGHLLGETTGPVGGVYTVAFADITPIRSAVGQSVNAGNINDIDKNGTVAFADISAMRGNIGAQLPNIIIPAASGGSGAPLMSPGSDSSGRRGGNLVSPPFEVTNFSALGLAAVRIGSNLNTSPLSQTEFNQGLRRGDLIAQSNLVTGSRGSSLADRFIAINDQAIESLFVETGTQARIVDAVRDLSDHSSLETDRFFDQLGS